MRGKRKKKKTNTTQIITNPIRTKIITFLEQLSFATPIFYAALIACFYLDLHTLFVVIFILLLSVKVSERLVKR